MKVLKGKVIYPGRVKGRALVTNEPIGFYGGIDPATGKITQQGHPLYGETVTNRILVFPHGIGSTVGSYILFRLKKNRKAPIGIIIEDAEPIVAVGGIISEIPMVYGVPIKEIKNNALVEINEQGEVIIHDN